MTTSSNNALPAPGLLEDGVHVWFVRPDDVTGQDQQALYEAHLSEEEQAHYRRLRFDRDRHLYRVSHVMLRRVLSLYADAAPVDWQFTTNQFGRPEIAAPDLSFRLRFNLSHTRGLAACIVAAEVDVGIDAEQVTDRRHSMGVAEKMFSETEISELGNMDGQVFLERFFTYWTLREAYSKACGHGLANPDGQFSFVPSRDDGWEIRFEELQADPAHWQLTVLRPLDTHMLALAVHKGTGPDKHIVTREFNF